MSTTGHQLKAGRQRAMVERPTRRHGMNEFVNFSKRGVELPAGCKDLADVLSLSKKMAGAPPSPPSEAIVPEEGLEHISNYMSRLIQSPARWRSVWINALGKPPVVRLSHDSEALQSLIYFGLAREGAIRNVLKYHAINPTQFSTIPEGWYYSRFILCPLASEAISVTQFVSDLLRKGFGLEANVLLGFRYSEMQK